MLKLELTVKGLSNLARNLDNLFKGDEVQLMIGRIGILGLWILGKPYK